MSIGGGANLGSAYGEVLIGVARSLSNLQQLQGGLRGVTSTAQTSTAGIQAWGFAFAGAGALLVGGIGGAINKTIQFDKQMSAVAATIGSDAIPMMDELREAALKIGSETAFSANEAGQAMEELAKAGVSATDILSGAAEAVTNLAAATGTDLPTSANVVANAMNVFSLSGEHAAEVADIITAAMNGSSATITDMQGGMRNLGPVVAGFGGDLTDAATAIALFTNYGLRGADAGVSLARGIEAAATPTDDARAKMEELGIAVFDAQGKFVGFPALFDNLKASMSGLTDEQRTAALSMIFGAEAADVMAIAVKNGGDGYRELHGEIVPAGQAAETAGIRMDNLAGDVEEFRGAIETAAIRLGETFTPVLREVVQVATRAANAFGKLPKPLQAVAGIMALAAGSAATLAGGYLLLGSRISQMLKAIPALISALSAMAGPLLLVIAVLAALGIAYKTNLGGFADFVDGVAGKVKKGFDQITAAVGPVMDLFKLFSGTSFDSGKFTGQGQAIAATMTTLNKIFGLNFTESKRVQAALTDMAKPIRQLRNTFRDVTRGADLFVQKLFGNATGKEFKEFKQRMQRLFGKEVGADIAKATAKLRTGLKEFGASFKEATGVDLGKLLTVPGIFEAMSSGVQRLTQFLRRDLIPALGPIFLAVLNGAIAVLGFLARNMDTIVHVVSRLASLVGDTLLAPFRILSALLRGDFAGALQVVTDLIMNFLTAGADLVGWAFRVGAPIVTAWASDLWDWLKETGLPGFFDLAGDVLGWTLTVGAPEAAGWVKEQGGNLWSWLKGEAPWIDNIDNAAVLGWNLIVSSPDPAGAVLSVARNMWSWLKGRVPGLETIDRATTLGWDLIVNSPDPTGAILHIAKEMWIWLTQKLPALKSISNASVGAWNLNIPTPDILGWLKTTANAVWPGLKAASGWFFTETADLGSWSLNATIPTITGWLITTKDHVWAGLKAAAGWFFTETVELGAWILNTGLPEIIGWLKTTATNVWGALKAAAGWGLDEAVDFGAWVLDVEIPDVTGWLSDTAHDVWGGLKTAAGWGLDSVVNLGDWTLFTAAPEVTGWVSDAARLFWPMLKTAAGMTEDLVAELGQWTLNTVLPTIEGWVIDVPKIAADLLAKIGHPRVNMGDWTLTVPTPTIAFSSGFDAGQMIRTAILTLGSIYVKLPWYMQIAIPLAIVFPVFGAVLLAALIIKEIGVVKVLKFAGWVLELALAATFGFVLGLLFDDEFKDLLIGEAVIVENFVEWSLTVGLPKTISLIGDFATNLGVMIWDQIKKAPTLSIGASGGGEGSEELDAELKLDLGESLAISLEGAQGRIETAISGMQTALSGFETDLGTTITSLGTLETALSTAFDTEPTLSAKAETSASDAITTLDAWDGSFTLKGEQYAGNLSDGYRTSIVDLMIDAQDTGTGLVNIFAEFEDDMRSSGHTLGTNLTSGFGTGIALMSNRAGEELSQTRGVISGTTFFGAGNTVGGTLVSGMGVGVALTSNKVGDEMREAQGIISGFNFYSAGYAVGYTLGEGINNGIAAWTSAIALTAAGAVDAAESAARDAADAHSPSRLFKMVGSDMGEGMYDGFAGWLRPFSSAASSFVTTGAAMFSALDRFDGRMSGAAGQGLPLAGTPVSAGGGVVTNNYYIAKVSVDEAQDIIRWGEFVDGLGPATQNVTGSTR